MKTFLFFPLIFMIPLVILFLASIVWIGLKVQPVPFTMPELASLGEAETIPLPQGLPEPVERFYRTVYGENIPVIKTAVFTGSARMRPFGIWLPARFIFVHNAGQDYRHYIEATFFAQPFMKVNEGYLDEVSFFESPMGSYTDDPNTNQAANLAVWAEASWFPSIWLTDPRASWHPDGDTSAILHVPFEDQTDEFLVRFNPDSGLIDTMEAMRYRDAGEGKEKILWVTRNEPGDFLPGTKLSATGSATWMDQGKPWAYFTIEGALYNVDVSEYIRQRGK